MLEMMVTLTSSPTIQQSTCMHQLSSSIHHQPLHFFRQRQATPGRRFFHHQRSGHGTPASTQPQPRWNPWCQKRNNDDDDDDDDDKVFTKGKPNRIILDNILLTRPYYFWVVGIPFGGASRLTSAIKFKLRLSSHLQLWMKTTKVFIPNSNKLPKKAVTASTATIFRLLKKNINHLIILYNLVGGWTNPIWKVLVKLGIFPT